LKIVYFGTKNTLIIIAHMLSYLSTIKRYNYSILWGTSPHWQKLWENHEKKTENPPQPSQNENIFVKIGELFANFDKNILTLRKLGKTFYLFLQIFLSFLSVHLNQIKTGHHFVAATEVNHHTISLEIQIELNNLATY